MKKVTTTLNNTDRVFRTTFISSNNSYSKLKFNKSGNTFKPKAQITPTQQDIYYDEVIYYDGGNVEGYGDDK